MLHIRGFEMVNRGEALRPTERRVDSLAADEVLIQIAGCGICHTDLGFLDDGVPTKHPLPLILGHEISGVVVDAGEGARSWVGREVIVPAVIPCGECEACRRGRGSICPAQIFPGNDLDGGFATHVRVPARGLCPVPKGRAGAPSLARLSVVADAVTTPYQSIRRSGLTKGDLAIFIGIGGVGAFGVQIASALGAFVVAIDVDPSKLERIASHGASLTLDARNLSARDLKKQVSTFAKENRLPRVGWKIFETSGTPAGQQTAFGLLVHGAYIGVVGFTPKTAELPLSHLMAFDAVAEGNWGCLPENYPPALDLVMDRRIDVDDFVVERPLSQVNQALDEIRRHAVDRRVVLVPDSF